MTLKSPTIVLFDMDGTTVRHINPHLLEILEWADDVAHKAAKIISKILKRSVSAPTLVEFHDGERPKLLVHRAIHKIRRKPVDQIVEPCPGIYRILDLLKENNIPMGIVSNGLGKGYGYDILQKFNLAQYFSVTIFREDITRSKPFPDPILQALRGMPKQPQSMDIIWYIGDRHKDVVAALAARDHLPCPVQPLSYGLNSSIAILEHNVGVDHIVMTYADLETKLKKLLKKTPA